MESMSLRDNAGNLQGRIVFEQVSELPLPRVIECTSLAVVSVVNSEIMREMQDPANAGAYFVLPSQLNGAEYPDNMTVVHDIADYLWDDTAGPRGQLAIDPAVGQFLLDNAARSCSAGGIDATEELLPKLVEAGHRGFELTNGYLRVPILPAAALADATATLEQELHLLKALGALEVRACGLRPSLRSWSRAKHRVSVIYASAVPVGSYNNPSAYGSDRERDQQRVATLVLRGGYFGAIRLALEQRGSTQPDTPVRLFVTPLGGGVFNNAPDEIARGLSEALDLASSSCDSGLSLSERLDVRLLAWEGKPGEADVFTRHLRRFQKLRQ